LSAQQALFAINRSIDVEAATLAATEFFWLSGLIFLALLILLVLARAHSPSPDKGRAGEGFDKAGEISGR
jgi:hypothetical protein